MLTGRHNSRDPSPSLSTPRSVDSSGQRMQDWLAKNRNGSIEERKLEQSCIVPIRDAIDNHSEQHGLNKGLPK